MPTVRVSEEVRRRLLKVKGLLEAERGEVVSLDEVIRELLDSFEKEVKS